MNRTILCFGDSNTWGFIPGSLPKETMYMERYPKDIRWTGRFQKKLGEEYSVIEEGLNGRTTNADSVELPHKNGSTYLPACLYSHAPLDLVILMLGINDLKLEFNRSAEDIARGNEMLIQMIQATNYGINMQAPPKILLVSPLIPTHENAFDGIFKNAIARAKQLAPMFKILAEKYGCYSWDAGPHIQPSDIDGLHFDEKAHAVFADKIFEEINKYIPTSVIDHG